MIAKVDWEANQDPWELGTAMTVIRSIIHPIDMVLEIGVQYAGSFRAWSKIASSNALLIGVDTMRADLPFRENQKTVMIPVASPQAKEHVEQVLEGRKVDLLFIDGDHEYTSVARDFETFMPLVRSEGLVALHDIRWGQVEVFWKQLKRQYSKTIEIHNRRHEQVEKDMRCYMGIGIVIV